MSALTALYGRGFYDCDMIHYNGGTPAFGTNLLMAAAITKVAMVGTLWHPSRTTFNIRKVHWRGGATSVNAASVIRVSLQDVSLTAGPPYQPDGTQDQFVDQLGSTLVANGANVSGSMSADRACAIGDSIGVVWEYGATGFTAADSFIVNLLDVGATNPTPYELGGKGLNNTAGTWALALVPTANVVFECDDGSYAYFINCNYWLTFGTTSIANNVTARAAGNAFTVATEITIDRIGLVVTVPNNSDNILKLFSGTATLLASRTIDNDAVTAAGTGGMAEMSFTPITLTPGTTYRVAIEGNSTTACTIRTADVVANGMLNNMWGGQNCVYTERDSGGSWTQTNTRRALMSIQQAGTHDGAGGGGGGGGVLFDTGALIR